MSVNEVRFADNLFSVNSLPGIGIFSCLYRLNQQQKQREQACYILKNQLDNKCLADLSLKDKKIILVQQGNIQCQATISLATTTITTVAMIALGLITPLFEAALMGVFLLGLSVIMIRECTDTVKKINSCLATLS